MVLGSEFLAAEMGRGWGRERRKLLMFEVVRLGEKCISKRLRHKQLEGGEGRDLHPPQPFPPFIKGCHSVKMVPQNFLPPTITVRADWHIARNVQETRHWSCSKETAIGRPNYVDTSGGQ